MQTERVVKVSLEDAGVIAKEFCSKTLFEDTVNWLYAKFARFLYDPTEQTNARRKEMTDDFKKKARCEHYIKIRKALTHLLLNSNNGSACIFPECLTDECYGQFVTDVMYMRDKGINKKVVETALNVAFRFEFQSLLASHKKNVVGCNDSLSNYQIMSIEHVQSNGVAVRHYEVCPKGLGHLVIYEFTDLNRFLETHENHPNVGYACALTIRYNYLGIQNFPAIVDTDDYCKSSTKANIHSSAKIVVCGTCIFNYQSDIEWCGYYHIYEKHFGSVGNANVYSPKMANKHIIIDTYQDELQLKRCLQKAFEFMVKNRVAGVYFKHPAWQNSDYMNLVQKIRSTNKVSIAERVASEKMYYISDENLNNCLHTATKVPSAGPYGIPSMRIVTPSNTITVLTC